MFTKEYVREVLTQMVAHYMEAPLSDEFVDRIYDGFVAIRNGDAIEHRLAADGDLPCFDCGGELGHYPNCPTHPPVTAAKA